MSSPALAADRPVDTTLRPTLVGSGVAVAVVTVAWTASSLGSRPHWWVMAVAVMAGAAIGASLPLARASVRTPGVLPLAVLCGAVAVYGCVPETDQMREVGFSAALIVVIEAISWTRLPAVWPACGIALVGWSGLYGATGRQSALIGALFALVAIPLLAMVEWSTARLSRTTSEPVRWFVLGTASASSVAMARTGGIATHAESSLRWLAVWSAFDVACCALAVTVLTAPNNSCVQD